MAGGTVTGRHGGAERYLEKWRTFGEGPRYIPPPLPLGAIFLYLCTCARARVHVRACVRACARVAKRMPSVGIRRAGNVDNSRKSLSTTPLHPSSAILSYTPAILSYLTLDTWHVSCLPLLMAITRAPTTTYRWHGSCFPFPCVILHTCRAIFLYPVTHCPVYACHRACDSLLFKRG